MNSIELKNSILKMYLFDRYKNTNRKSKYVKVSEIAVVNPKKSEISALDDNSLVSFIPMEDLYEHKLFFDTKKTRILKDVYGKYTYFRDNDVIIAKVTPCFENGKAGLANNLINGIGFGSSEFIVVRANNSVSPKWLYYYFVSYDFKQGGIESFTGTAGLKRVSRNYVENYMIYLPSIEEQQRIVEKIEELLPLVEEYGEANSRLESLNSKFPDEIKQSILQYAIQGKLVEQREEEGTAEDLYRQILKEKEQLYKEGKIKKSKPLPPIQPEEIPFEIPSTWKWERHSTFFEVIGGSQPNKNEFRSEFNKGYCRLYQIRDYGENPKPVFVPINSVSKFSQKNEILLARYGASLGKVFFAEDGAYNVALAKVNNLFFDNFITNKFKYYYYKSNVYQDFIKNNSRSAQAGFNKEDFNKLIFPLPPLSEQKRIVEKIEEFMQLLNELKGEVS